MPKKFSNEEREKLEDRILQEYKLRLEQESNSTISVNDLVKIVGIAKGTFYLIFENKEDLFLRVLLDAFNDIEQLIEKVKLKEEDSYRYFTQVIFSFTDFIKDNMWLINASGKEFNKSYSQLSKGGKKLIDEKKEELWHCFISYLKKDLMVETSIFIDSVSVILFSNSYSVSLIDFKQTYLFLVESLGKRMIRREK
ncbi:TetR/AcrR family transcriptional regulator [Enterococcus hulanensis]|uniref:TetR/AcrR family transcriptional regulator n=1 Tax=Enterococcus hulanensis TaxID=2559929 RepID=UPI0010F908BB|nr:TetR/AcrR family transcriptional regulator [Enterococcus hulanensis]MBO0412150.1 TetR/AcrR family transcriptional regulator [Enterococcus hulanensis]MBO0456436.1 TetR/AcrR family transcriptional regulator [Enterococcus hulanensis]